MVRSFYVLPSFLDDEKEKKKRKRKERKRERVRKNYLGTVRHVKSGSVKDDEVCAAAGAPT